MRHTALLLSLLLVTPLVAQQRTRTDNTNRPRTTTAAGSEKPDVVLDVPNLSVDDIRLDMQDLRVNIALDARVGNLVTLTAGADAAIENVKLQITGVEAEAYLVVRLDRVAEIIDRTLTTIDENPEIVTRLLESVDNTVGTVGNVANTALQPGGVVSQTVGTVGRTLDNVTAPGGVLSQTVNTLGQTVVRTVDTTGRIVERTLDTTGRVINDKSLGAILDLPVISETKDAAGQVVKQVRDTSGAVIEYTLDSSGKLLVSRVVSQATGMPQRK